MKTFLTMIVLALFTTSAFAAVNANWHEAYQQEPTVQALSPDMVQLSLQEFLSLTPQQYEEMTGQTMGLKEIVALKAAQKYVKNQQKKGDDIEKGLYILLAILGLAWVAMGVMDDWSGNDWIVNLILTVLCWLPGFIHALVKMKKYY